MKNKTIHLIAYKNSPNIGDNFQTLTTKKVLEGLWYTIKYVDRDAKDTNDQKTIFINGYYSPKTIKNLNLEFSENTNVIFHNIHLAWDNGRVDFLRNSFLKNDNIYKTFKRFQPVGARDQGTADLLSSVWIDAINNECITLLMEKRTPEQEKNAKKLILVDVDEFVPIPKWYKKEDIEYKTQVYSQWEELSNKEKLELSQEILKYYKNNAKLMITSRFHCAMPCIAMWIPVIFFGDKRSGRCHWLKKYIQFYDYIHFGFRTRTQLKKWKYSDNIPLLNKRIKNDFNIIDVFYNIIYKIYLHFLYAFRIIKIDWDVKAIDIEDQKKDMINKIDKKLKS